MSRRADHEHTGEDAAAAHDHATEAAATETTAHSHGDEAATADHEPRRRPRRRDDRARAHRRRHRRRPGGGRRGVAATVGPDAADRLLRCAGRDARAAGPRRGPREDDARPAPAVRRRLDAPGARLPVDRRRRAPGTSTTSTWATSSTTRSSTRRSRSPSCTPSMVTSARSCPRCSSPRTRPSTIRSSSISAEGSCNGTSTRTSAGGLNDAGEPVVVGLTDAEGNCAPPSVHAGGENPMVHVWIAPHECGPFAALEGHGAGQTAGDGQRVDQCAHEGHGGHAAATAAVAPVPYDPTKPIDLSGVEGVTPEQQAYAENLVADDGHAAAAVVGPGGRRGGRIPLDR